MFHAPFAIVKTIIDAGESRGLGVQNKLIG